MRMTREAFVRSGMVALAALVGLPVVGCGSDGGEADPGTGTGGSAGSSGGCGTTSAEIAFNHGHALSVSAEDISAGVEKTYDITGSSLHSHSVTLTADHLAELASGQSIVVASTEGGAHTHDVTVTCA